MHLKRAEQIQEAQQLLGIGPAPLDRAALLTVFAQLRMNQSRYSEAFDLYVEALAMIKDVREDHPLTAFCLEGLGEIDLARGRLGPSADHFQESLAVRNPPWVRVIASSPTAMTAWRGSPWPRRKQRRPSRSSRTPRRSLTRELGPTHPDSIEIGNHARRHEPRPHPGGATRHPRDTVSARCRPCSHSDGRFFMSAKIGAGSRRTSDRETPRPTGRSRCIDASRVRPDGRHTGRARERSMPPLLRDSARPFRSIRPPNRLERSEVFDARQIAGVLAEGHFADQAAEDLAAAGLGQLGDEPDVLGGERLAQGIGDPVAQLGIGASRPARGRVSRRRSSG